MVQFYRYIFVQTTDKFCVVQTINFLLLILPVITSLHPLWDQRVLEPSFWGGGCQRFCCGLKHNA